MQVILKEDVPHLGQAGEVVRVKNGYGRNYLIPQSLAVLATPKSVKHFEHQKRVVSAKVDKMREKAATVAERLEGFACTLTRHSRDNDMLFGSVSTKDIANALAALDIDVARRQIGLSRPIKELGIYPVDVRLHADIRSRIHVWVVAKG